MNFVVAATKCQLLSACCSIILEAVGFTQELTRIVALPFSCGLISAQVCMPVVKNPMQLTSDRACERIGTAGDPIASQSATQGMTRGLHASAAIRNDADVDFDTVTAAHPAETSHNVVDSRRRRRRLSNWHFEAIDAAFIENFESAKRRVDKDMLLSGADAGEWRCAIIPGDPNAPVTYHAFPKRVRGTPSKEAAVVLPVVVESLSRPSSYCRSRSTTRRSGDENDSSAHDEPAHQHSSEATPPCAPDTPVAPSRARRRVG